MFMHAWAIVIPYSNLLAFNDKKRKRKMRLQKYINILIQQLHCTTLHYHYNKTVADAFCITYCMNIPTTHNQIVIKK